MSSICFWGDTHPAQLPAPRMIQKLTGGMPLVCNLEAPLTRQELKGAKSIHLWADPGAVDALNAAGVAAVHVANNHMLDAGPRGLDDTIRSLKSRQIQCAGLLDLSGHSTVVRFEWDGVRVAIIGYGEYCQPPLASLDEEAMVARVRELAGTADRLIVSLHWGIEYVDTPSPAQRRMARRLLEAGADLIVGHHPHVTGGVEYAAEGAVVYSLGNASFWVAEGEPYPQTRQGIQLRYDLHAGKAIPESLSLGERPGQLWYSALEHAPPQGDSGGWNSYLRQAGPIYLESQAAGWRARFRRYGLSQIKPLLRWFTSRMFLTMAWGYLLALGREKDRRG
jgi:hypothetical protein